MYKKFYNLSQNPFQLNSNIEFFFESAGHKRAKAYLRYGLKQGEGFVVVTGVPGTGKTLLVKELFNGLSQEASIIIGLLVSTQLGAEDILRVLSRIFKLPCQADDNKATLLLKIESFLLKSAQQGKRVLLVVDEAQNIPIQSIEELRMLANFEWDGRPVLQIFLIGRLELSHLIQSKGMEQVQQRIVANYHLKAIKEDEIAEYIKFRLKKAGWKNNPQFLNDVFTEIYNFTQGIPRKINTLCDRLLLYGYLEELTEIDSDTTKLVINEIKQDYSVTPDIKSNSNNNSHHSISLDAEERIAALENRVDKLTASLIKEKALLRKALLIQLDLETIVNDLE